LLFEQYGSGLGGLMTFATRLSDAGNRKRFCTPEARFKFKRDSGLRETLNQRVEQYFRDTGKSKRGGFQLWFKTLVMLTWFWSSYIFLVFGAGPLWQVLLAALSAGVSLASVGFNVMHDGSHGAYANKTRYNHLAARSLDMLGASSYMWHFKHVVLHHTYPNIEGIDDDIEAGFLLRLSPKQPRRSYHRLQHWYVCLVYGLLTAKWQVFDDLQRLFDANLNGHRFPRPKGMDLAVFLFGKAFFFGWAFVIPTMTHSFLWAIGVFYLISLVSGNVMALTFQLAHCIEGTTFPKAPPKGEAMSLTWAEAQLATTADFMPGNRLAAYFFGGLNYQIEHHLFPKLSHTHYPAIAPIVEQVFREHGLNYRTHKTLRQALRAHWRHLVKMGLPDESAVAPTSAAAA